MDEGRTLNITPQLFVCDDKYTKADLWIKKLGNAPLIFQRHTPSAVPLTKEELPTYTIRLYRGARLNNDFALDHHRFVFINDAKAGFRRFIHEWELYRRTCGTLEELEAVYKSDYDGENMGRALFPLWHEDGKMANGEKTPRGWTAIGEDVSESATPETHNRVYHSRLLEQSLIWCRTFFHL